MTSLYRYAGDLSLPVVAGDVSDGQLFSALDPGHDRLLALFKAAIIAELAAVWAVARVGTALASAAVVADTCYEQPRKSLLREAKFSFPLLALYRTESEFAEHTLVIDEESCKWRLEYILGPLSPEDHRRLGAILRGVKSAVALTISSGGHPAYDGGAVQFHEGKGRFASIALTEAAQGVAEWGPDGEGPEFHTLSMVLETTEHMGFADDIDPDLEGVDVTVGLGGAAEGVLPDAAVVFIEPRAL